MPNPSPHKARQAKKRRRTPGDLATLLQVLWGARLKAEAVLDAAGTDSELTLKAVHAVSQCAGQYSKFLEVGELEARLAALETQVHASVPR